MEKYLPPQEFGLFLIFVLIFQIYYLIKKLTDSTITAIITALISVVFGASLYPKYFFVGGLLILAFHITRVFTVIVLKIIVFFRRKTKPKSDESIYLKSNQGLISIDNIYRGSIIMGGAGSGKSKSLFYPIIQQLVENNFAGALYDFKAHELSEVAHFYHNKRENKSIKFANLSFKDYKISSRVNPLDPKYITKQAIAFEMATVLINNLLPESIKKKDYWTRSSISIVAGSIWYLRNNYPQYSSLPHLIAMILDFPSPLIIEKLTSDMETAGMISSLKEAHEMKAEKQIAGVVGTLKMALAQLNIPEVFYLLSADDVNLELNNTEEPTFLCIGNDSSLAETYAPIISLIISVCARLMNQPGQNKSAIILDEAVTLFIPNFEQIPATARSNKVATFFGLQDYSQMIDKYGRDKAQVMISNLGNQFFGRTVNEQTAKMIINLFGRHDVKYKSSSTGKSDSGGFAGTTSKGTSESYQQRDRVSIKEITNMSAGTFFGVIAEGNKKELLNTRMKEVEANYLPFEENESVNPKEFFKQIYEDIKRIKGEGSVEADSPEPISITLD